MFKRLFIAGTDTDVGKTAVSQALLQALTHAGHCAVGYKPVAVANEMQGENWVNSDAVWLQSTSAVPLTYAEVNPVTLRDGFLTDNYDNTVSHAQLSQGLNHLSQKADTVIIEGTGGWRVLMQGYQPLSEWVVEEGLPVLLVVGIKTGCISHALLTTEAIQRDGLQLVGWVANRINPCLPHYANIIDAMQQMIQAPKVGEIPYLPRIEQRELFGYVDLAALNLA